METVLHLLFILEHKPNTESQTSWLDVARSVEPKLLAGAGP